MGRSSDRFRVHLEVRYANAAEFVREYAENLSAGGLFVAGVTDVQPLDELSVELELPGLGRYRLKVQVAHVMDEAAAARFGSRPGAGVAIRQAPPDFDRALSTYLQRLGRRADQLVLVESAALRAGLEDAGYKVDVAPDPGGLVATIARMEQPVLRVVVGPAAAEHFRDAARAAGDEELVVVCEEPADLDAILTELDALI